MSLYIFIRRAKTALSYGKRFGFVALYKLIVQKTRDNTVSSFYKKDVLSFYDFVRQIPSTEKLNPADVSSKIINWVIPPYGRGSGGHLNIFRFISNLEQLGFTCYITIVGKSHIPSEEQAQNEINEWFLPLNAKVFLGIENSPPAFYTFATGWQTAYDVAACRSTVHRCYFVQDFEPWFYSAGSEYVFAEETYKLGLIGITAGDWLAKKLSTDYGMTTYPVGFSFDRALYKPIPKRDKKIQRVFFYARPPTSRRAFELGLLVLDEVVKRMPDVKVVFAGWDVSEFVIPFEHLNAGTLSLEALPDLYGQCDVALVLSFSNLSLLPLELMACGVPVVSNTGDHTQWLLNEENSILKKPTVLDLATGVCAVLQTPELADRLRINGIKTAENTDWMVEAQKMASILNSIK